MSVTLQDGLTVTFEVSWTTDWNATPSYEDESAFVKGFRLKRGRSSQFDQFQAGTLSVDLENSARLFDPLYASSTSPGNIVPRKLCRLSIAHNAVTYRLFTGFLDGLPQYGEPSNKLGWATLNATDGFKILARAKLPTGGASVGGGETLSARIGRLLDYVAWPAGARDIDPVSPTSVETQEVGQPILAQIYEVTNGDLGQVFVAGDGDFTYHGHAWQLSNNLTASATLADLITGSEIPYTACAFTFDDTLIFNRATATNYTGPPYVLHTSDVEDATSVAAYGESVKDLGLIGVNNMNVVQNTLEYILAYYKDPKLRVTQVSFNPRRTPATMYPVVLGAEIGTRYLFTRRPQNVGSAISQDVLVEGITHSMTSDSFTATFDLSQASTAPDGGTYWRMGFGKATTGSPAATWA